MSPIVLRPVIIAWICLEIGLAIHNGIARRGAAVRDRGSKLCIIVAIAAGLVLAFRLRAAEGARIAPPNVWPVYAAGLFLVAGLVIRVVAVATLRNFFTTTVTVSAGQKLIRSGPYAHIRHPAYLGSILIFAGIGFSFNNWLSLLALLACVVPAFLYRIGVEERALAARFGDEYAVYARKTKRLLPGIY